MKKILSFTMLITMLSLLTACGGGSESTTVAGGGGTPPISTPVDNGSVSNDLVIDNGRGTTNNQDTESAQD